MLEKQKQLLAEIESAQRAALKLLQGGVKISGVVQKLRAAAEELTTRVRYLEAHAPARPKPKAADKAA